MNSHHINPENPAHINHGHLALCRWCGDVHEGTAGYTIGHWKRCVGIAAYSRFHAFFGFGSIAQERAIRFATWMYRDFPTVEDASQAWGVRDYATRLGLIAPDEGPIKTAP